MNPIKFIVIIFWKIVFWWKHRSGFIDLGKDITVTGIITYIEKAEGNPDGDYCFNLKLEPEYEWAIMAFGGRLTTEDDKTPATLHCEVTPWTADQVKPIIPLLKLGTKVKVSGRWGFDGVHTGKGMFWDIFIVFLAVIPVVGFLIGFKCDILEGWLEIHAVKSIEIL